MRARVLAHKPDASDAPRDAIDGSVGHRSRVDRLKNRCAARMNALRYYRFGSRLLYLLILNNRLGA